jgi:RAB protein geranylgeranyltransferase component A
MKEAMNKEWPHQKIQMQTRNIDSSFRMRYAITTRTNISLWENRKVMRFLSHEMMCYNLI